MIFKRTDQKHSAIALKEGGRDSPIAMDFTGSLGLLVSEEDPSKSVAVIDIENPNVTGNGEEVLHGNKSYLTRAHNAGSTAVWTVWSALKDGSSYVYEKVVGS